MEVTYWICILLITTILLHRQLLTSKHLCCWLGGSSAVLKDLSRMHWCKRRGGPEVHTRSGRAWQQQTLWKWLTNSLILEHFQSCSLLLLLLYFSLPKTLSAVGRNEWQWLPSTPVPFNFVILQLFVLPERPSLGPLLPSRIIPFPQNINFLPLSHSLS